MVDNNELAVADEAVTALRSNSSMVDNNDGTGFEAWKGAKFKFLYGR